MLRDMRFVQVGALLLGVGVYIGIFAVISNVHSPQDSLWILAIAAAWNIVLLVATVLAIVDAVLKVRSRRLRQLGTGALLSKLVGIPFFVLNYGVLALVAAAGLVVPGIGLVLGPIVAVGIVLTYLTMLSTSVYAWATIAQLRRDRLIGTQLTVLYIVLSLVFVVDIAVGIMTFGHSRRRPFLTLLWLLGVVGLLLVAVGAAELDTGFIEANPMIGYTGVGWLLWVVPLAIGVAGIAVIVVVVVTRRPALRAEAQRASLWKATSTAGAASAPMPAG